MVRVPVRAAPVFVVAEKVTMLGPDAPAEADSHDTLLVTVQAQPASVVTVAVPVPPPAGRLWLRGAISMRQGAPACMTFAVELFKEMSVCRAALVGFGAT